MRSAHCLMTTRLPSNILTDMAIFILPGTPAHPFISLDGRMSLFLGAVALLSRIDLFFAKIWGVSV